MSNKQIIDDAITDAGTVSKVTEGPEDTQVTSRTGRKIWTLSTLGKMIQIAKDKIVELNDAIEIAAAAGAGANGWTDLLIRTENGRTQRDLNNQFVYVEDFGGKANDPNFDNSEALQKALLDPRPLRLNGFYYTTGAHYCYAYKQITGTGTATSGIRKTGGKKTGLPPIAVGKDSAGKIHYDYYDVDCILAVVGQDYSKNSSRYANEISMYSFKIDRADVSSTSHDMSLEQYGLYAPRIARSVFHNFHSLHSGVAIRCHNPWMVTWFRCEAAGRACFALGSTRGEWDDPNSLYEHGGTSNTMISCWARGGKSYPYIIGGMNYSSMISCGADYNGSAEVPCKAVYYFLTSQVNMISCGMETTWGKLVYARNKSHINIVGINAISSIFGDGTVDALVTAASVSTLHIDGGWINAPNATNKYFSSRSQSRVVVSHVDTDVEQTGITRDELDTDRSKMVIWLDKASLKYETTTRVIEDILSVSNLQNITAYGAMSPRGNVGTSGLSNHIGVFNSAAGAWNLGHIKLGECSIWRSNGALYFKNKNPESATDGLVATSFLGVHSSQSTVPNNANGRVIGGHYFNSTTNKPMWWNGSNWVDANGQP